MKIAYISDLHLEFYKLQIPEIFWPPADVLILAGDVVPFTLLEDCLGFFDYVRKIYPKVLWVPGNHEYYGAGISYRPKEIPGITLLDKDFVILEGVCFIGATLWSKPNPLYPVADMRAIDGFNEDVSAALHENHKEYIDAVLDDCSNVVPELTKVVITHHLPSLACVSNKYKGSPYNGSFASDCDELVHKTDFWVHGHTHDPVDKYMGDCRVMCNPRGYPSENAQPRVRVFYAES